MIRCLVVDDEPLALEILTDYIEKVPFLTLQKATTSAFDGLSLVQQGAVDLVFLDVQMPELTGIEFLRIIEGKCPVVLTTAYSEYAIDGFEHSVVDYLLKPFALDRFYKAAQKAQQLIQTKTNSTAPNEKIITSDAPDFIFVKTEYRIQKIYINNILYIEGLKDYVSIFTTGERIITLQHMKKLEEALPHLRFSRVHKSFIVSIDKISSIERGRIFIEDKIIPIGDTYRDAFFKKIETRNI